MSWAAMFLTICGMHGLTMPVQYQRTSFGFLLVSQLLWITVALQSNPRMWALVLLNSVLAVVSIKGLFRRIK